MTRNSSAACSVSRDGVRHLPKLARVYTGDAGHGHVNSAVLDRLILLGGRNYEGNASTILREVRHVLAEDAYLLAADPHGPLRILTFREEHARAVGLPP